MDRREEWRGYMGVVLVVGARDGGWVVWRGERGWLYTPGAVEGCAVLWQGG